jgi:hypothetical protein
MTGGHMSFRRAQGLDPFSDHLRANAVSGKNRQIERAPSAHQNGSLLVGEPFSLEHLLGAR